MKPQCLVLLAVLLVTTACTRADADRAGTRPTADALSLLREWDHQRSRAWAGGDPAALADLYAPGSRTGRRDHDMLAAYADRGLRVIGLRTQVLGAALRFRAPGRMTLEVTDRVVGGRAVGRGLRIPLPRDRPSTRLVTLRRVAGTWRVAEVRPAPRPPRP